jgi:hypothetical protein
MENPFKAGDAVLTKVKDKDVSATVRQIWRNEVQVKVDKGEVLWRTMYTVWYPGSTPLAREDKQVAAVAPTAPESTPAPRPKSAGKNSRAKRSSKRSSRQSR